MAEEVNVKINVDANGATKNVSDLSGELKSAIIPSIALAEGIKMGVDAVIEFGKASIEAYKESLKSANELRFTLEKIGNEGESAFQRLVTQADALEATSLFSNEEIQDTQAQLVQSLDLTSQQVEELTPKIIELASAQGVDLGTATSQVINGLNGQEKALKKAGIAFEATGNKTKDLSSLMNGLDKFAGASAISLETSGKGARSAQVAYDNLKEKVGEDLLNAFHDFGDVLFDTENFLNGNIETTKALNEIYKLQKDFVLEVTNNILKQGDAQRDLVILNYKRIAQTRELSREENIIYVELLKNQTAALTQQNNEKIKKLKEAAEKEKANAKEKTTQVNKALTEYEKLIAKQKELEDGINNAITKDDATQAYYLGEAYKTVSQKIALINQQAKFTKGGLVELNHTIDELDALQNEDTTFTEKGFIPGVGWVPKSEYDAYLLSAEVSANTIIDGTKAVSDAVLQITSDRLNAQMELDLSALNEERSLLDMKYKYEEEKSLNKANSERLTESQTQLLRADLNAKKIKEQQDLDKKEAEIRRKAFNREKALNISKIILNAAVEAAKISGIIASFISGVVSAPLAAAGVSQLVSLGISTAAQTAVVAAQKPPAFAKGGLIKGKGTNTSDSIDAKVSNGESIINANSTSMFAPLLSAINEAGGGKSFKAESPTPSGTIANTTLQPIVKAYVVDSEMTKAQKKTDRVNKLSSF